MEELKNKANKLFKLGNYEEAINIYTKILNSDPINYIIILNRSAVYIKMERYQEGLEDAVNVTKMNQTNAKAWGRVGAALYGLNRLEKALIAYNKANELKPNIIYQNMIKDIQKTLSEIKKIKNRLTKSSVTLNKSDFKELPVDMTETLHWCTFQNKVMSLGANPLDAFKDGEVMEFMNDFMKMMKIN